MNKKKLKSKMALFGDNGADLSGAIGVCRQTLSAKMCETNGSEFTQGEIMSIKDRYNLTPEELNEIFFTDEVS